MGDNTGEVMVRTLANSSYRGFGKINLCFLALKTYEVKTTQIRAPVMFFGGI